MGGQENSKDYMSNLSFYLKDNTPTYKHIEGPEMFACIETLTAERIAR